MELREAFFRVQKIAPVSDEEVEALYADYAQAFEKGEYKNMQWETLDEIPLTWDKDVVIVEPGEMHQETCEFIVPRDVESAIYTHIFITLECLKFLRDGAQPASMIYRLVKVGVSIRKEAAMPASNKIRKGDVAIKGGGPRQSPPKREPPVKPPGRE